jgi:hypothetical protein
LTFLWSLCMHHALSTSALVDFRPPVSNVRLQDKDVNKASGASQGVSRLNNMLMQMRKVGLSRSASVRGYDV